MDAVRWTQLTSAPDPRRRAACHHGKWRLQLRTTLCWRPWLRCRVLCPTSSSGGLWQSATRVQVKGGGRPTPRTVQQVIARCRDSEWCPGKPAATKEKRGRPLVYTEHPKAEVARVGMSLKRQLIAPTPRRVRARLPQMARHPTTGDPMDKKTIHAIFKTRCHDGERQPQDTWV